MTVEERVDEVLRECPTLGPEDVGRIRLAVGQALHDAVAQERQRCLDVLRNYRPNSNLDPEGELGYVKHLLLLELERSDR